MADTVRAFCSPSQNMVAHPENDLSREILLRSAAAKFVLFGAISLFRNGQVVQRPDCRCWSAGKMSAQYKYWPDLSRPELSVSQYLSCRPAAYALDFLSCLNAEICGKYLAYPHRIHWLGGRMDSESFRLACLGVRSR